MTGSLMKRRIKIAPVRNLEEWTGIGKEMLPPAAMLNGEQVHRLLEALKKMLDAYNWLFVLQHKCPNLFNMLPSAIILIRK